MQLRVEGELEAEGVTFTAANANDGWGGIVAINPGGPTPSAVFRNSTIEHARHDYVLSKAPAALTAYNAEVTLIDTDLLDSGGLNTAGLWAAGSDAFVRVTSASSTNEEESLIENHSGHGVVVTNDAEVVIDKGSIISLNDKSGVYASAGGRAVLDQSEVLSNGRYGLEAFDYGEIDFQDTGEPSLTSSYTENTISSNTLGGVLAKDHASVSAGSYNDLTGECYQCANTISLHAASGAPVDVKAELGSVVFAESDYWGPGITQEKDLVLVESGGSIIEVTPLLTSPPSAGGGSLARGGTPAQGRSGGDRALFVEARKAAAEGDYVRAFVLLREVIQTAEDQTMRRLAYTEATRLLRVARPPSVMAFLEDVAGGGSAYRPWALRALVVAYAAAGQTADAEAAAGTLAADYGGSAGSLGAHARFGTLAQFRLRLAEGDLAGAETALAVAEATWPEHEAVAEAGAVFALVTGEEGAGERGAGLAAQTGTTPDAAMAKAASDAASLTVYPNPTSGAVSIALTLDAPVDASVGVYDVLGREVVVLQEGSLNAGRHALSFDAVGLPAGVYVMRFVAGDAVETQRITVVR